jgi:hypothetical protein
MLLFWFIFYALIPESPVGGFGRQNTGLPSAVCHQHGRRYLELTPFDTGVVTEYFVTFIEPHP